MMREATSSWGFFILTVALVFHCIATTTNAIPLTNSRTTLLSGYGPTSTVITTLEINTYLKVHCRIQDVYVFDDPWWLNVTVVADLGMQGWVADYFVDCGYIGYCDVPAC